MIPPNFPVDSMMFHRSPQAPNLAVAVDDVPLVAELSEPHRVFRRACSDL